MPAPFVFYEEAYNGSVITVSVERDTDTFESSAGPVPLHTVLGMIDSTEQITEDAPLDGIDNRPGLRDRIPAIIQILRNEIDSQDEFMQVMTELGFTEGSDPVVDYTVTPGSGSFTHDWFDDPDFDIESIQQADDPDFTVNLTTIHTGPLTPPITDGSYGSGVTRYFRMRGQRTGLPVGPWSYASGTTL